MFCSVIARYRKWSSCFFFQAEDGIRDLTVTGVQTCALPISFLFDNTPIADVIAHFADYTGRTILPSKNVTNAPVTAVIKRSEERRVGKEWRSRWSPYH